MFSPPIAHSTGRLARLALGACVLAAALAGCADRPAARAATPAAGITLTDDGGRPVHLAGPARRVISLIPSATETLVALGATDRLVGRTRYDVAPEVAALPSVGGGLDPSIEAIVALHPDLVLGWENDKRQEVRQKLASLGVPVFAQLIGLAGGESVFPDVQQLWPTVSMEEIVRRAPDLVVVPRGTRSRGEAPGTALAELRARGGWRDVGAVRAGHVVTVDENLVNRPGPHLGAAARALRAVLHPELAGAER